MNFNKLFFFIFEQVCPMLLRKNLAEIFPTPEVASNENLTLITLSSNSAKEENGAKNVIYLIFILIIIYLFLFTFSLS